MTAPEGLRLQTFAYSTYVAASFGEPLERFSCSWAATAAISYTRYSTYADSLHEISPHELTSTAQPISRFRLLSVI
jgi:hypothetical protein